MPKKVVYLLGAGASAYALPVVKDFNIRLDFFRQFLISHGNINLKQFANQVANVLNESAKHSTIDTLAKKYFHSYLQNKQRLIELKRVLIGFFIYEQKIKNLKPIISNYSQNDLDELLIKQYEMTLEETIIFQKRKKSNIDPRYDSFIAALLKPKQNVFEFPENVSILTWNYDSQIELTFKNFYEEKIVDIQRKLSVYPFYDLQPIEKYKKLLNAQNFKILHLNGIADFIDRAPPIGISQLDKETEDVIADLLYADYFPNMTFAWERNGELEPQSEQQREVFKEAIRLMSTPCILVIIGYSFPYFNREIDKELFMYPQNFSKIYVQDPNAEVIKETLLNVFRINRPGDIITQDISQFILPPE